MTVSSFLVRTSAEHKLTSVEDVLGRPVPYLSSSVLPSSQALLHTHTCFRDIRHAPYPSKYGRFNYFHFCTPLHTQKSNHIAYFSTYVSSSPAVFKLMGRQYETTRMTYRGYMRHTICTFVLYVEVRDRVSQFHMRHADNLFF